MPVILYEANFVNILSYQYICFVFVLLWYYYCFSFFALQISWVIVPMGQYTHQLRGLNRTMVTSPSTVEVSITL